ncbi:hypothetical protein JMUB7488_28320 [Staphylococcus aureus]
MLLKTEQYRLIVKNNLRYGLRKHKLRAASVCLGTMFVVVQGQDKEAAASE